MPSSSSHTASVKPCLSLMVGMNPLRLNQPRSPPSAAVSAFLLRRRAAVEKATLSRVTDRYASWAAASELQAMWLACMVPRRT